MRKITPTSKSESYRLLKFENYQSFQNESNITDLLLSSLIAQLINLLILEYQTPRAVSLAFTSASRPKSIVK